MRPKSFQVSSLPEPELAIITQCYKKKSGLSQKRDQPILVVISSQNKNVLADFLDQFVCARYSSLKSGIPPISL